MRAWTEARIRELGLTTDVPTAFEIVSGGRKRDAAYRAVARGKYPLPILDVGGVMRVPTSAILALLGIDGGEPNRLHRADLRSVPEREHTGKAAAGAT